jgi:putative sigma-54 modulation protein
VQIKISTRHGHLNDDNRRLVEEKASKLLHYFGRLMLIEVTVDITEDLKSVEVLVSAEHKHDFVAHETNHDLLVALDKAVSRLEHQVRKYKEKIQDHRRDPSAGDVAGPANLG